MSALSGKLHVAFKLSRLTNNTHAGIISQVQHVLADLKAMQQHPAAAALNNNADISHLLKEQAALRGDFQKLLREHVKLRKDHNALKAQFTHQTPPQQRKPNSSNNLETDSNKRLKQLLCGGSNEITSAPKPPSPSDLWAAASIEAAEEHRRYVESAELDSDSPPDAYEDDEEVEYPREEQQAFPLYKPGDKVEMDSRIHSPNGHNAIVKEVDEDKQLYFVAFPLGGRNRWIKQTDIVCKGW